MAGGSRIVAIGSGGNDTPPAEAAETVSAEVETCVAEDSWDEPAQPRKSLAHLAFPAMAVLAILGWTGFFGWVHQADMQSGASPETWAGWVSDWAIPVLLVCTIWLLAMRNSRREASRFGDAARLLSSESVRLEERLVVVNRELSLAREFISAQGRDLEALGRMATERLSQNADRLQALVKDNGAQVDAIATVSAAALENMDRLRGQLPVIASSAKDVSNNIATAGRTAQAQLQDMVEGFHKLNEFGQASGRQVDSLRARVNEALAEFARQATQLDEIAGQRFAALAERGAEFRTQLDSQEVEALAAIRSRARTMAEELDETRVLLDAHEAESLTSLRARLAALRDEGAAIARALRDGETKALDGWRENIRRLETDMQRAIATLEQVDRQAMETAHARLAALVAEAARMDERLAERNQLFTSEIARRQTESEAREEEALARFGERLSALDAEISARIERQMRDAADLAARSEEISAQLAQFGNRMADAAAHGGEAQAALSASLTTLAEKLIASREALAGTDKVIAELTDNSVRLLELIQASVQHSSRELPHAIEASEARLGGLETRIFALRDTVGEADARGESLSNYVIATNRIIGETLGDLGALHDGLDSRARDHAATLADLRQSLARIGEETAGLADHAQGELRAAIDQLATSARDAVAQIETLSAEAISAVAERLAAESGAAIDRVMQTRAAEAAGQLEQAAAHAAGISREATVQLRDQLARVNELAGNLERRVAQAREKAEEQVDNDFARRMALITESLNSNAIDIAKALSSDVTDTAWAAYLRGDRGVFTRRAVRLLDTSEARSIAQIYETDRDFREHVSHYIHDFEAMLRQLLSTRDGHALGVTMLSSDMGKLYVALAQAIERLRA